MSVHYGEVVWAFCSLDQFFFRFFFFAHAFWLRQVTTHPHILAGANIQRPDEGYPKPDTHISELILDSYQYVPAAHVAVHCMS